MKLIEYLKKLDEYPEKIEINRNTSILSGIINDKISYKDSKGNTKYIEVIINEELKDGQMLYVEGEDRKSVV